MFQVFDGKKNLVIIYDVVIHTQKIITDVRKNCRQERFPVSQGKTVSEYTPNNNAEKQEYNPHIEYSDTVVSDINQRKMEKRYEYG
jgi:hypothetical protein